ncbi:MAG TPA: hypothetical protein PK624_01015 [Spirochaetota bacterium]|nr:hypothetical protein [Spirochaetota bacterium]HOR43359.1 hypothetical protein [Spirochaetota bacterium]HOU85396.1 hypothetical protein [Spirochaetota bacterium]HPK54892.1 hypothetical protein [Spirochaetota bacterium]HQE59769.1 hypothetical protein [Spirochaetota bacterium]
MNRIKEKINSLKIKLKPAIDYVRSLDWTRILSAFAYFPFIGWIFPLYLKTESENCQKNSREGFYLSAVVSLALTALFLFRIVVASGFSIFLFIITLFHIVGIVSYFAFSVYLIYRTYRFGSFKIPFLSVKAEKLNI